MAILRRILKGALEGILEEFNIRHPRVYAKIIKDVCKAKDKKKFREILNRIAKLHKHVDPTELEYILEQQKLVKF